MRKTIVALLTAVLVTVSSASPAHAALTEVNVRIEGASKTLFEGPILSEGHDVNVFPFTTPASMRVHGPWQIAATGRPVATKS